MLKYLLSIFLFIGLVSKGYTQDPVFSQFYAAPLHINPAFAGITYTPRVTFNYRNEWPAWPNAYVTYAATYEQSLSSLNSGFGLILMTDNAGDGRYRTNRLSGVYGYTARTDKISFKFGLEAGVIQSTIDWDQLTFGDQLDPINGAVDPSGNPYTSEEIRPENLKRNIFDFSVGVLTYSNQFYAGISLKHINNPSENFLQVNEALNVGTPSRLTIHGGAEIFLERGNNRRNSAFISPNIMFVKQAGFGQVNAGAYTGFGKFFGGLWYRHTFDNPDAGIAMVGFKKEAFRIGYSYDFTISSLSVLNTGGTHELSFSINFDDTDEAKERRRREQYLDCFKMFN